MGLSRIETLAALARAHVRLTRLPAHANRSLANLLAAAAELTANLGSLERDGDSDIYEAARRHYLGTLNGGPTAWVRDYLGTLNA